MIKFKKYKFYNLNLNNSKFSISINSILFFISFLVGSYALIFWVSTINQPIIDLHAFRQAQTAISARYLGIDGSNIFNYHTPVLGYPWHLPFEFPIFQILAKLISSILSIELTLTGRLLNIIIGIFNFLIALKVLNKWYPTNKGKYIFFILYFSSGIYLYWNRAFLIENTALFFSLLSINIYLNFRKEEEKDPLKNKELFYFFIFLTLGLLSKATTTAPLLAFIVVDQIYLNRKNLIFYEFKTLRRKRIKKSFIFLFIILISFFITKIWISHTDHLKMMLGGYAEQLTSSNLKSWNYGTLFQRINPGLWKVILERSFPYLTWIPLFGTISISLLNTKDRKKDIDYINAIFTFGFLWLMPLLFFFNLHLVHEYYQSANHIYILLLLSIAADRLLSSGVLQKITSLTFIFLIIFYSYQFFFSFYEHRAQEQTNDKYMISSYVRENSSQKEPFVVVGDFWSSEILYNSNRKGIMISPGNFKNQYKELKLDYFKKISKDNLDNQIIGGYITDQEELKLIFKDQCPSNFKTFGQWSAYICN